MPLTHDGDAQREWHAFLAAWLAQHQHEDAELASWPEANAPFATPQKGTHGTGNGR